ncbi:sugar ABC transporter substrate-binding protein [Candidatus Bathyarchaeota archaeon]|nr:sugar ABC transporter substrate-binding protein [Candidatus Bathyarchaeota archaeon]
MSEEKKGEAISRRKYLKYVGAGVAVAAVAAAGVGGYYAGRAPAVTPTKKVTLRYVDYLWTEVSAGGGKSLAYATETFKKMTPEVEDVKWVEVHWETTKSQLIAMIGAGDIPDAGLVTSEMVAIKPLVDMGALEPLDEYLDDELKKELGEANLKQGMYEGKIYGILGSPCPNGMLLNRKLFEKAGLMDYYKKWPEQKTGPDWEEFEEAIVKISNLGPDIYGFGTSTIYPTLAVDYLCPIIWGFGGDLMDKDGKPIVNSKPVVETMRWLKWGHYDNKYMPTGLFIRDLRVSFAENKLGMWFDGPWMLGILDSLGMPREDYAACPIPKGKVSGKSETVPDSLIRVMFKASKNKDLSWKWIKYLTSDEEFLKMFMGDTGFMPAIQSYYKTWPEFQTTFFRVFAENVAPYTRNNIMWEVKPELYDAAAGFILSAFQSIIMQGADPQKAMDECQRNLEILYGIE